MEREIRTSKVELKSRQDQFGALLEITPEKLRHLEFCDTCRGDDYEWTDWSSNDLELSELKVDSSEDIAYRNYLASLACKECDGTGFEGGSFQLTQEEWINLGQK